MKHQDIHSKIDFLDLSVVKSQSPNSSNIGWFDKRIDHSDSVHLDPQGQNIAMSSEELKIRGELEMDVERDLEEEIKDGIYHLALRLHRLYQHRKERNQQGAKNKTLSEVNISIRMEGGTKIEIKEIKKDGRESGRPQTSRSQNVQGTTMVGSNAKRFDWAKSLRSGTSPHVAAINKKNNSFHQANLRRSFRLDHGRRNCSSALGQPKGNAENKLLELGWRT
ncbi:uncharacterized protein LOC132267661 [Cornus florida]|uniref:uncharacterized protein LOC132267661 n=1 Tax=Cornus florida TaxID=4283 RepID=UPI00289DDC2B|nr:uncharacterized protein LOC132267661 [Cornus florida]